MKATVTLEVEIPNNVDAIDYLNECSFNVIDADGKELETEVMDYDYEEDEYSDDFSMDEDDEDDDLSTKRICYPMYN